MEKYLAQASVSVGGQTFTGPEGMKITSIAGLINTLMPFVLWLASAIVFFVIVWGGYDILMSQGDSGKVESGKTKITSAIVGLILLTLSYVIAKIISSVFGLTLF